MTEERLRYRRLFGAAEGFGHRSRSVKMVIARPIRPPFFAHAQASLGSEPQRPTSHACVHAQNVQYPQAPREVA